MNVGDERSISCWMDRAPVIEASTLNEDESCDVVLVGAGIAGLSTAYELARLGRSVVVIDRGAVVREFRQGEVSLAELTTFLIDLQQAKVQGAA